MAKDSKRYAATGGWGFGRFINGKPADEAVHNTCFSCHGAAKLATLSSAVTHLDIERIEQACFRGSQPAGDAWLRKKYRTSRLNAKVILLVDARIQRI